MEMNANEKCYLSADGVSSGHHQALRTTGGKRVGAQHNKMESLLSPNPKQSLQLNKCQQMSMQVQHKGKTLSLSSSSSDPLQRTSGGDPPHQESSAPGGRIKPRNCRRVVVLGAPKVGKTNLVRRFLGEGFEERYVATSEDFHRKIYHIRGKPYLLDILDAAREREFPAKRRLSILTGDIFLLVFSLDDLDSLHQAGTLRHEILSSKTTLLKLKDTPRVPIVICGNKADLGAGGRVAVSRPEISEVLGEDTAYLETSTKTGAGLDDAFRALVTLGGLPGEVIPSQHRTISLHTYQSLFSSSAHHLRGAAGRRRKASSGSSEEEVRGGGGDVVDSPCAALCPLARRPSFNSDLKLVLGSSSSFKNKPKKCQIQ